ncbi:MAG TPA: DUF3466 family protein [Lacipirellulaceae bacterium]
MYWLLLAASAGGTTTYTIFDIGLTDAEQTRSDGRKYSEAQQLNEAGQVIGYADLYSGSILFGRSAWLYTGATTVEIGLTDAEHTHSEFARYSMAQRLNEAGQVIGYANRYSGGFLLGRSAWLYNGASTAKLGLTDAEHTRNDGYKYSEAQQLNEASQVIGYSTRYSGLISLDQSAWLYNGEMTVNIGLTNAEHTRSDGLKYSGAQQLNAAGRVIGYSARYNGSISLGQSAWLYNGATTVNIGLIDAEHTLINGSQSSGAQQLNEAGQVMGQSYRRSNNGEYYGGKSAWLYNGSTTVNIGLFDAEHPEYSHASQLNEAGQGIGYSNRLIDNIFDRGRTAWLYNGASTVKIGFTDAEHTHSNGTKYSLADQINEAGQVIGYSARYDGDTSWGYSAWLYNGATTVKIGLTDAEHTLSNGRKSSSAQQLNEVGQVIGYSGRYIGQSAWLYDGVATMKIGLTDAEHTRSNDTKYSEVQQLNEAGQVIGYSNRYNGSSSWGQSAWLYDGVTTVNIGLTDAEHTRSDGYKYSQAHQLNEEGQVIGQSARYSGLTPLGQDAWVHDPVLDATVSLQLSVRTDGYAFSSATLLGEDGGVLGYYNLYDGMSLVGERALYWSRDDGLWDLGKLVEGGLDDNGWAALYRSIQSNGLGQFIGYGIVDGLPVGSRSAYLLTPMSSPLVPGDYNENGTVDAADYVVWRKNDGTEPGYDTWRTNFGRIVGATSRAAPSPPRLGGPTFAVPEPAAATLGCILSLIILARRQRGARQSRWRMNDATPDNSSNERASSWSLSSCSNNA